MLNSEVDPTKMGRLSCINLQGNKEKMVSIYSAYQVPQDSLPGKLTAYAQQLTIMIDVGATNLRPRRQFITDLIKDIKQKKEDPHRQIILGIDANEIIESPRIKVKTTSISHLVR